MNNRFAKGSGVYTCRICGKSTRETGQGESSIDLCVDCYLDASQENTHSDNHSRENPDKSCKFCKAEGWV